LEDEVDRLQIENRELRTHCDDLQAQLLHNSVECGRSLLGTGSQPSLAAELNGTNNGGMDEQKVWGKIFFEITENFLFFSY